jgi:hypothetical protein
MKTLALTPWDISHQQSGGTERCYQLLTAIPDLTTFALSWDQQTYRGKLEHMPYQVIAADAKAVERAQKLFRQGIRSYDAMPTLCAEDLTTIRKAIDKYDPDLVILEHPWLVSIIGDRPFVLDAHNCETYSTMMRCGRNSLDFDLVQDIEQTAVEGAEHITYCSEIDWQMLKSNWTVPNGTHIPNGTHLPAKHTTSKSRNLIFIGSMYQPNVDAAQTLANLAHQLPEYSIHLIGASSALVETSAPNVTRHGHVDDKKLDALLRDAHILVNLVTDGSGTHLKLSRCLAYGIPVVTTKIGSRGYEQTHITDIAGAPTLIRAITADWTTHHKTALKAAKQYDWQPIRQQFAGVINALQ